MSKVIVAFRKNDKSLAGWFIRWWTKGPYSHVAIVIDGIEYSSSGATKGVYHRVHKFDPENWDYVELGINKQDILQFYNMTRYDKYDFLSILGFVAPVKDRSKQWDCSEWVSNALKISGVRILWTKEPAKISPNHLYRIIH